uniref:C2H2-type domain-containing protein n=1 Tax=Phlebotomus papatasi TaxID=29031 RepID=A0A1B0EY46_PHLPP
MCEQTNAYDDGDIVWVKLSNCWWPGEVCKESRLPDDLVNSLKKKPFAVVKFFQEDAYEYVKNINNIYKYQCSRKGEFIRKGLDLHKSNHKYMEKFPADVTTAEKLTGGDLDIVQKIQSSPQKSTTSAWSDVFNNGKVKKGKKTLGLSPTTRDRRINKIPKKNVSPATKTFLSKPREHEVRFLSGNSSATKTNTESSPGLYKCHACPFSCNRINVIVLHSKTHSTETVSNTHIKRPTSPKSKAKRPILSKIVTPLEHLSDDEVTTRVAKCVSVQTPVVKPPKKRGKRKISETLNENSVNVEQTDVKIPEVKQPMKKRKTDLEWKNELLADWSEDEEAEQSSENNCLHTKELENKEENFQRSAEIDKMNQVPVIEQKKEKVKSPPIKYRNIPKKDRRDIVLESGELMEINKPNTSIQVPIAETLLQEVKDQPEVKDIMEKTNISTTEEDEEDMVLDSISRHRQKKLHASEFSIAKKAKKSSRQVDELKDEKLCSDIESLLKATVIPQIPETPKFDKVDQAKELSPTKELNREIALPPKERGKRIFKSKNRSKSGSCEVEDEKTPPKAKSRESTEKIEIFNMEHTRGSISPSKEPTESDLQIAQTLIDLPDHTPPLNPLKDGTSSNYIKNEYGFSDCKETNAAEVLMNLGNLTETRSKDTNKSEEIVNVSPSKSTKQFSSSGKLYSPTTVDETQIKLPENITVTKVIKPALTSPNQSKTIKEYKILTTIEDKSSEKPDIVERVKIKKGIPKKRKPNIDISDNTSVVEELEVKNTGKEVVRVPSPPASPKKIIKIKSQMKSPTQVGTVSQDNIFDIKNMPIVLTDEPLPVDSVVMSETKSLPSKSTSMTSNGQEQGMIISKFGKSEDIVINQSALLKKVKLIDSEKEQQMDSSISERITQNEHKFTTSITERKMMKLPPKKLKDNVLSVSKSEIYGTKFTPQNVASGNSVMLTKSHAKLLGQRSSPTKILYSSENHNIISSTTETSSALVSNSQMFQGKLCGQIVITSKGKVITKQSDAVTTTSSASLTAEVSSSFRITDSAKISTSISKMAIKSPAKIHVQSQQIIYKPPKEVNKSVSKTVYVQQPKKSSDKMEISSFVESQRKVFRRIKKPTRLETLDAAGHSSTNTQKSLHQTIGVQDLPPLAPISSETLLSNCVKKVVSSTTKQVDESAVRLKTTSTKSSKQTGYSFEGAKVKKASTSSNREKSETLSMSTESTGICSSIHNIENSSNIQDSQLLAIPGESFGGPANSFFLCTLDNGTFIPIDNQPLYLDASNQLVPQPPDIITTTSREIGSDIELGHDAILEVQDNEQIMVESDQGSADGTVGCETKYVLNTGNGQQILLDQQSLLAIAAGDIPRLVTPEGQELIFQGSSQDILSSIALNQTELGVLSDGQQIIVPEGMVNSPSQDILAVALAGTEVFSQDNLIADVPQIPAANPAQVSETNAVLTQPPIMSTLEVPSKTENIGQNVALEAGFSTQNLDDSLAVIGVTGHQTNVPTSLELPITVTNPAIAPKTTTSPMSLTSIYLPSVSTSSSQMSPSIPIVEEIFSGTNSVLEMYQTSGGEEKNQVKNMSNEVEVETTEKDTLEALDDIIEETTAGSENAVEIDSFNGNDIVPVTPESLTNHGTNTPDLHFNDEDGNSSHSSEIPIQPDLILRPEDFTSSNEDVIDSDVAENNPSTSEVSIFLENLTRNSMSTCSDSTNQNSNLLQELAEMDKEPTGACEKNTS